MSKWTESTKLIHNIYLVNRHCIHIVVLLAATWLAFGDCISHQFVWDDHGLIVDNYQIQNHQDWHSFFFQDFWKIGENVTDPGRKFYRPLIILSYKSDFALWGLKPAGYHITNILAHCACLVMVYFLLNLILQRPSISFLATLAWGVHPTHVENVCWISGRTDVFCAMFLLMSFLFFTYWEKDSRKQAVFLIAALLSYSAALFCKEIAIMFPALCIASYFLTGRKRYPFSRFAVPMVALGCITILYLLVRATILGHPIGPSAYGTAWQRIISVPYVLTRYTGLLLTMVPVDPHHPEQLLSSVLNPSFALSVIICSLLALFMFMAWKRNMRQILFFSAWFILTLAPTFHLGSFGDVIYADRFLYIPSIGFFTALILVFDTIIKHTQIKAVFASMLICYASLLGIYSRYTSFYWRDGPSLFYRASQTSPDSAYVFFNLGNSLMNSASYKEAYDSYLEAIRLLPEYKEVYPNIGAALNKLGQHRKALIYLSKAIKRGYAEEIIFADIADAYVGLGNSDKAIEFYRLALQIKENPRAHNNLGLCYLRDNRFNEASNHFDRAVQLSPGPYSYNNLAKMHLAMGNTEEAITCLNKALSFPSATLPDDLLTDIHYTMALAADKQGNKSMSFLHAQKALDLIEEGKGQIKLKEKLIELLR